MKIVFDDTVDPVTPTREFSSDAIGQIEEEPDRTEENEPNLSLTPEETIQAAYLVDRATFCCDSGGMTDFCNFQASNAENISHSLDLSCLQIPSFVLPHLSSN